MTLMPGFTYFDTSALAKRYVEEKGSAWVNALLNTQPEVFVSTFTYVEIMAALSRRAVKSSAEVVARFEVDFHRGFSRVAISPRVIEQSSRLARDHRLRAGDALQLASALIIAERIPNLVFVCADEELNTVTRKQGLKAENPNAHT